MLGKVLRVKSVICVHSAPNLAMLSGLSAHGALSRVHTSIFSLLWLKTNQTKTFYIILNGVNLLNSRVWFGKFCHFKLQTTLSLPVT